VLKSFHILLVLLMTMATATVAYADDDLQAIYDQMKPSIGMTADFKQIKTITVLSRPLVSQGAIHVVDGETISWHQDLPYIMMMKFTSQGIIECLDDCKGEAPTVSNNPFVTALSQAFIGLLAGSPEKLETYFDLSVSEHSQANWKLLLAPNDAILSGFIKHISITGDEHLQSLIILEMSGDKTLLTFSNHQHVTGVEPK